MTRTHMSHYAMTASANHCAEASFACTSCANFSRAMILDTILVSIFVVLIGIIGLITLINLMSLLVVVGLLITLIPLVNFYYKSEEHPLFVC